MSKRIAVWFNVPSGGSKRQIWYHVRGLKARGYEVEAFRPPVPDSSYLRLDPECEVPLRPTIVRPIPMPFKMIDIYTYQKRRAKAMAEHAELVAQRIREGKFDLLFANTCLEFASPRIGRHVELPKLLYLNEPKRFLYESIPFFPFRALPARGRNEPFAHYARAKLLDRLQTPGYRFLAREELDNAKAYDRILVNSHFSRESVTRSYGLDSRVCYLGVDTNLFVNRMQTREPLLVGLSSFLPMKNIDLVVRAVAASKKKLPLVWVCNMVDEGYRAETEKLAEKLGVAFEVKPSLSDSELVDLLNRASAMVYAPRLEPFGLAPLEAGSCGVPIIAVPEGGVRETVIEGLNGLLAEPEPEAIAAKLDQVLSDSKLAQKLGEQGSQWVREQWSLESCCDRLTAHVESLLK